MSYSKGPKKFLEIHCTHYLGIFLKHMFPAKDRDIPVKIDIFDIYFKKLCKEGFEDLETISY